MKVRELMEVLSDFDPEMEVHTSYNYGDHWRTQVAPKIMDVQEGTITYSDYHRMPKVVEQDDYFEDEEPGNPEENVTKVVIIG